MKKVFLFVILACWLPSIPAFAQQAPYGLPPGYMEKLKEMLPPGTQLPAEMGGDDTAGSFGKPKPLIDLPHVQETRYKPQPSSSDTQSPFGSGRTPEQKAAAIAAINAELDAKPYILPIKAYAPAKSEILKLAKELNTEAKKKFAPDELAAYAQTVTWMPRFDGLQLDPKKATQYSILVSTATNYFTRPRYIVALATAVFSLDPQGAVSANNLASAVVSAGERLGSDARALATARKQAEAVYAYTLANSLEDGAWKEKSFTPILNLGYLYIDMGRPDEACSLFRVARKLKPFSWDAAQGLAAYFIAIGQRDKAKAVLEDENLDKPAMLMVAKKSAKLLEKSDPFGDMPLDAPEERYKEGIEIMNSEPIATAADFIGQLDQSERNKMRHFIENLPPKGSFNAPSITKVSQYSNVQAISSPQGVGGLKEFAEMVGMYTASGSASIVKNQMEMLSRMGLNIDPGVDLDDLARHPEKYEGKEIETRVTGKEKFKANMQAMADQAKSAKRETKPGQASALTAMVSTIDPFFTILQIEPEKYADPMNVAIQKHNFAVHNRKTNLYNGYLFTVNKQTYSAVLDVFRLYVAKLGPLAQQREAELEALEEQLQGAMDAISQLKRHAVHAKYFEMKNNATQVAYANATNVSSVAYVQKIKPTVEAYYYDVIRHVAMISDPGIRKQKDLELKSSVNGALMWALQTVLVAHGSYSYDDEWDCDCDIEALLRQRDAEQAALDALENERIARNKAAKKMFDSGEIPESSPLFKKLDAFGTDLSIPFIPFLSGRISCARTVVRLDTDALPIPGIAKLFGSMSRSENTGAATYAGGVEVGLSAEAGAASADATLSLSGSVSTDGNGNVRDYSVTPATSLSVSVGDVKASLDAQVTVGRGSDGNATVRDYSMTAGAEYSTEVASADVSVGGKMTFGPNGLDSDFTAGISKDIKTGYKPGKGSLEASTKKRGCSVSTEVTSSFLQTAQDVADQWHVKEIWSGEFKI